MHLQRAKVNVFESSMPNQPQAIIGAKEQQ